MPRFWYIYTFLWILWPQSLWGGEKIAVIAYHDAAQSKIELEEVRRIYLRTKLFWNDGSSVIPVNLPPASMLRRHFSRLVLGVPPEDLEEYWNSQYFHGVAPPYVLASEAAVLQFVATTPGAIGYVSDSIVNSQVQVLFYLPLPAAKSDP